MQAVQALLAVRAEITGMAVSAMRSEWKPDVGEMKAGLYAREARLIKWIAGLVVAGAAAAAGVAIAVNQIFGPGVGG